MLHTSQECLYWAQTLKERYYDKYDVIISTDGLDIIPDNSTVIKLTIDTLD